MNVLLDRKYLLQKDKQVEIDIDKVLDRQIDEWIGNQTDCFLLSDPNWIPYCGNPLHIYLSIYLSISSKHSISITSFLLSSLCTAKVKITAFMFLFYKNMPYVFNNRLMNIYVLINIINTIITMTQFADFYVSSVDFLNFYSLKSILGLKLSLGSC